MIIMGEHNLRQLLKLLPKDSPMAKAIREELERTEKMRKEGGGRILGFVTGQYIKKEDANEKTTTERKGQ